MYQTMTQIGKAYEVDAKTVGKVLYDLGIRDANHPEQKGFPYEQAVTHGIAKAFIGRSGDIYYRYDIERIKEEFETKLADYPKESRDKKSETEEKPLTQHPIAKKLQQMLSQLNHALETGEINTLYRLKADIADIYALLPAR